MSSGIKYDQEKRRYDLIPTKPLEYVADVFTLGAKKYGDYNWTGGIETERLFAAAMRHMMEWKKGIDIDEIGTPHLSNAIVNLMMILEMQEIHPELDNRIKAKKVKLCECEVITDNRFFTKKVEDEFIGQVGQD